MESCAEILRELHSLADASVIKTKQKRFGIVADNALGIYQKDLNALAKQLPKDTKLAMELFDTGIYEARLLCAKLFKPAHLTEEIAEKWVKSFTNWEDCDSFCLAVFGKSNLALHCILEFTQRTPEYEKRAGFATMASYCMADKKATNDIYEQLLEIVEQHATDERLYVKKAVNWALRSIGKRNRDLQKAAIACANRLVQTKNKTAYWVGSNALQELTKKEVRMSDYPRSIYRPSA